MATGQDAPWRGRRTTRTCIEWVEEGEKREAIQTCSFADLFTARYRGKRAATVCKGEGGVGHVVAKILAPELGSYSHLLREQFDLFLA